MNRSAPLLLFIVCIFFFTLTNSGSLREPDSEVVFRLAEQFADGNGLSLPTPIENWPGFGMARGQDSLWYAIYPPGESIVLAPIIYAARPAMPIFQYDSTSLPLSHFLNGGLRKLLAEEPEPLTGPHALRFIVSFFNVLAASFTVLVFYGVLRKFQCRTVIALLTSVIFALGTPLWFYSGSYFSETLTTLCLLGSFYFLLKDQSVISFFSSGLLMGFAIVSHTTAILCVPFYLVLVSAADRNRYRPMILWVAGVLIFVTGLAVYNFVRFGDFLETGRNLSEFNRVAFLSPAKWQYWRNFLGLLISPGKGLLIFCPAIVLGVIGWRSFSKAQPLLARVVFAMIITRILFIAAYQDWHGGFGLGPRYLVIIVPFALIPAAVWLGELTVNRKVLLAGGIALWALIVEQWYFVAGELFSYLHVIKWSYANKGLDIFLNDRIYWEWKFSPLGHLLPYLRGPYFLKSISLSNNTLWLAGAAILGLVMVWIIMKLNKHAAVIGTTTPLVDPLRSKRRR